uniref:NADH-ubiquinone oxidoreductase chain 4L n=1 Tax=Eurythenes maldoror TaxID=1836943 RepID=A0A343RBC8_9CRUS|nr:NADH dehydrogenase subunit 4L [Eurythenes maldoror]ATX68771.1 NADH dehydrogenase subunit 4L [Eurythenes maldoror]
MVKLMELGGMVIVISGLFSFIFNYSHVLGSLLSLELIGLGIYFLMGLGSGFLGSEMFCVLYFLVMMVSEGVLGISLLVMMSSTHSSDMMKHYNSLLC